MGMSMETGSAIIESSLRSAHRLLSRAQRSVLSDAFSSCRLPLYLKLALDTACTWRSYSPVSPSQLGVDNRTAIDLLYTRLERVHGETLVSRALSYLVTSRSGLSDVELEDALSLDNEVLDDVYQHWSPPHASTPGQPTIVRMPPLLWARLRHDLREYLVERQADGKTVLFLYHRQFIEAARWRYLQRADLAAHRHFLLAEYFAGRWAGDQGKAITLRHRNETLTAERKVQPQPLWFAESSPNYRKLNELPFHLYRSGEADELMGAALANHEWIACKSEATSMQTVIEDYNLVLSEKQTDPEVLLIRDCLVLAKPTLEYRRWFGDEVYSNSLACELLGRLRCYTTEYPRWVGGLIRQAELACVKNPSPSLIPETACFPAPGGLLKSTLISHQGGVLDQRAVAHGVGGTESALITVSADATIRIWDTNSDELVRVLEGHTAAVNRVEISRDERTMVTSSSDDTLRVWSLQTGECIFIIEEHHKGGTQILAIATVEASEEESLPKLLVLSCSSRDPCTVNAWRAGTGTLAYQLHGHSQSVTSVAVSPDESKILVASLGNEITAHKTSNGEITYRVDQHRASVTQLVMGVTDYVISGGDDAVLVVFEWRTGSLVSRLIGHDFPIECAVLSRDDSLAVSAAHNEVRLWRTADGVKIHTLMGHHQAVNCVILANEGELILSAGVDQLVIMWDAATGGTLHVLGGFPGPIHALCPVAGGNLVSVTSRDSPFIKLWKLQPKQASPQTTYLASGFLERVILRPLGVVYTNRHCLEFWDAASGRATHTLRGHRDEVTCMSVSHRDHWIASGSKDATVKIWNILDGKLIKTLPRMENPITCCSFRKDDTNFLACDSANNIKIWSLEGEFNMKEINSYKLGNLSNGDSIAKCRLPNSNEPIIGTHQGAVVLMELGGKGNLRRGHTVSGGGGKITAMATSNDQRLLAVGSATRTVLVVAIPKGTVKLRIDATNGKGVTAVAFTEDSRQLVTASSERIVKVWDALTGVIVSYAYVYSAVTNVRMDGDILTASTAIGQLLRLRVHSGVHDGTNNPDVKGDKKPDSGCIIT